MSEVIDDRQTVTEPVAVKQPRRGGSLAVLLFLIIVALLILWVVVYHPFASGKSTNVNVNVPTPTLNR